MILRPHSVLSGLALLTAVFASLAQAAPRQASFPGLALIPSAAANDKTDATPIGSGDLAAASEVKSEVDVAVDTPVHSPETDERLAAADRHFNLGREYYFQANLPEARREFDAAVETLLDAPDSVPDRRRIERRLDEMCDVIYRLDVEDLGSGETDEDAVVYDKAPIDEISHMTFPVDPNLAPKLKNELNQTASAIPLDLSDPVLGVVHYFSTERGRKILLAGLRRSGRYRPLIERIFAEEGVPEELIYLAQAESGFLPRALSKKKAVGMWQFIAGTGDQYALAHNAAFDDRFDPEKATRAAAKFLKDLHTRYGDWYLAMAAYNCGPGAVDRAVERTGYADYWELLKRHALPKETSGYVPIIVAMTIMAKNPKDYGLDNVEVDAPIEYDSIRVTAATNLNLIADATMQPASVIRDLNPSLLKTVAPAGYEVNVPKGSAENAQTALDFIPAQNRQSWRLHHVEAGDTLAGIARLYHLPAERLLAVNRAADSMAPGDMLLVPAVYHEEQTARVRRTSRSKPAPTALLQSHKSVTAQHATHIAASHPLPRQIVHRKAPVHTASLAH
jgi:membrane-bound lytic murein transglycosylase D